MLEYELLTKVGGRLINEDCVGMMKDGENYCFVLADGLGGHSKGEVASELVVNCTKELFHNVKDTESFLKDAFACSQQYLQKEQQHQLAFKGMKTTLVILVIVDGIVQWGHVGDSRVYYFFKNHQMLRSLDHSVPQMLVNLGEIKEKQIRGHEDRNRLLKVMGLEEDIPRYELSEQMKLQTGQAFLLCTDGLWELIEDRDMANYLKKEKDVYRWLGRIEQELLKKGKKKEMDNYSAIGIKV